MLGAAAIVCWLPIPGAAQTWESRQLRQILDLDGKGFAKSDWKEVAQGKPAAETIPVTAEHELALVGAIRIDSSVDCYLDMLKNIETFKSGDVVIRVKKLPQAGENR